MMLWLVVKKRLGSAEALKLKVDNLMSETFYRHHDTLRRLNYATAQ